MTHAEKLPPLNGEPDFLAEAAELVRMTAPDGDAPSIVVHRLARLVEADLAARKYEI